MNQRPEQIAHHLFILAENGKSGPLIDLRVELLTSSVLTEVLRISLSWNECAWFLDYVLHKNHILLWNYIASLSKQTQEVSDFIYGLLTTFDQLRELPLFVYLVNVNILYILLHVRIGIVSQGISVN